MKYAILILILVSGYTKCYSQAEYIGISKKDTIYDIGDLPYFVDQEITLVGKIRNSKKLTLHGVDIQDESTRGKRIKVTGILIESIVEEKDVDSLSANRGAGTFYSIRNENIEILIGNTFKDNIHSKPKNIDN